MMSDDSSGQPLLHSPLAIVGMACRLPGADGIDAYWDLLLAGRDAIVEVPPERLDRALYFDPVRGQRGKTYTALGGLVADRPLDPELCPLSVEEQTKWDRCHLMMCEVAASACRHAGMRAGESALPEHGCLPWPRGGQRAEQRNWCSARWLPRRSTFCEMPLRLPPCLRTYKRRSSGR